MGAAAPNKKDTLKNMGNNSYYLVSGQKNLRVRLGSTRVLQTDMVSLDSINGRRDKLDFLIT